MTREELRISIVNSIDQLLALGFLVRGEQRRILQAGRAFWLADDGTQLDKVLALLPAGEKP